MIINRYTLNRDGLQRLETGPADSLDLDNLEEEMFYWFEVVADERREVVSLLTDLQLPEDTLERIAQEGRQTHFRLHGHCIFADLPYRKHPDDEQESYLGMLIKENILVTLSRRYVLSPDVVDNYEAMTTEDNPQLFHLLYNLVNEFIADQVEVVTEVRTQVVSLARRMAETPQDVDSSDILELEKNVADLSVTVTNQYNAFNFLPRIDWGPGSTEVRMILADLTKKLAFAEKSLDGIHQLLESIHLHSVRQLQEKSNRRINILTIVQAIFVPLTLLVGIYGMNFENMPELSWPNAYFYFLGGMVLIAATLLTYFYKKGWFD
jgi:magnesium/cobalt transport protein CorA